MENPHKGARFVNTAKKKKKKMVKEDAKIGAKVRLKGSSQVYVIHSQSYSDCDLFQIVHADKDGNIIYQFMKAACLELDNNTREEDQENY